MVSISIDFDNSLEAKKFKSNLLALKTAFLNELIIEPKKSFINKEA